MIDETQFVCPHCKQQIKHCAGMSFGEIMSMRHNKQYQDVLLYRLRAENEKLRAALRPFAGNRAFVMNSSDMSEAYRAAAAALKETGDE